MCLHYETYTFAHIVHTRTPTRDIFFIWSVAFLQRQTFKCYLMHYKKQQLKKWIVLKFRLNHLLFYRASLSHSHRVVCIILVKSFFIEDEQMSKHTWTFGSIMLYYISFVTAIVVAVFSLHRVAKSSRNNNNKKLIKNRRNKWNTTLFCRQISCNLNSFFWKFNHVNFFSQCGCVWKWV